ncbi:MAG: N-formylglutamate deformylase, partial [Gammaproteobacteria bacterium]
IPHAGTHVPETIFERFTLPAKQLPDTDWHLEQLYAFAHELGVHILIATHSRYVIDLNRAPDGQSLYPGKFTTGLCPTTLFDGSPIYKKDREPDDKEVQERIHTYWQPYHNKLQTLIDQLKHHPRIVIFDAHSIRSQVPLLFEGVLPDLNLGTADGLSAHPELTNRLMKYCQQSPYSVVCNGRFKGGYITRHYGQPAQGIDAVQLELTQINYMQETYPFIYENNKANTLQLLLRKLIEALCSRWLDGPSPPL